MPSCCLHSNFCYTLGKWLYTCYFFLFPIASGFYTPFSMVGVGVGYCVCMWMTVVVNLIKWIMNDGEIKAKVAEQFNALFGKDIDKLSQCGDLCKNLQEEKEKIENMVN